MVSQHFILLAAACMALSCFVPSSALPQSKRHTYKFQIDTVEETADRGSNHDDNIEDEDPFTSWLRSLVLSVPPVSVSKLSFTLTLANLTCTDLSFVTLSSQFNPSQSSIKISPSSLSMSCFSLWEYHENALPHLIKGHGTVSFDVLPSTLSITLQLLSDHSGLPQIINLLDCHIAVSLSSLAFTGGITATLLELFHTPIQAAAATAVNKEGCRALTAFLTTFDSEVLNTLDSQLEPFTAPPAEAQPPPVPPGSADLRGNIVLAVLDFFIDDLAGFSGTLNTTFLSDALTNGTGKLHANLSDLDLGTTFLVPTIGPVSLSLDTVSLAGLDSWRNFSLFAPVSPYTLSSIVALGSLSLNVSLAVSVPPLVTALPMASPLSFMLRPHRASRQDISISMDLSEFSLLARAQVATPQGYFKSLAPNQVTSGGCLTHMIQDTNVTLLSLNSTLDKLHVTVQSLENGSPLARDFDTALNNAVSLLVAACSRGLTSVVAGLLDGPGRTFVNSAIDHWTHEHLCEPAEPSSLGVAPLHAVVCSLAGLVVFVALAVPIAIARKRRAKQSKIESHSLLADETHALNVALGLQPLFSLAFSLVVVFLLLTNAVMFVVSDLSLGAAVVVTFSAGSDMVSTKPWFTFSMVDSTKDMWDAGVYALAIVVAVCSGFWPFIKLLGMLLCWLLPPSRFSVRSRDRWLRALDALGKYSLIDFYILTIIEAAFFVRQSLPAVPEAMTPADAAVLFAEVVPTPGVVLFLLATMLSLAMTHIILYAHRRSDHSEHSHQHSHHSTHHPHHHPLNHDHSEHSHQHSHHSTHHPHYQPLNHDPSDHEVVCGAGRHVFEDVCGAGGHVFGDVCGAGKHVSEDVRGAGEHKRALGALPFRVGDRVVRCTTRGRACVAVSVAGVIALVLASCVATSLKFHFRGLASLALEKFNQPTTREFSVLTLTAAIPLGSSSPWNSTVLLLMVLFMSFTIIIPLIYLAALFSLWTLPFTLSRQRRVFVGTEILQAWSALEVFGMAVVASLTQLEQFATFVVGDKCDALNIILEQYFVQYMRDEAYCFSGEASLAPGASVLFTTCFVYCFVGYCVLRLCHKILQEFEGRGADIKDSVKTGLIHCVSQTLLNRAISLKLVQVLL